MSRIDTRKIAGSMGRIDWSKEPGIQSEQPTAPQAVRVSYLLQQIAQEFRALKAAAVEDGKPDILVAKTCTLELALTWTLEGEAKLKFWVLELGGGVSRETAQTITVKMTLLPEVRMLEEAGADVAIVDPADVLRDRDKVTKAESPLRLAFMLERLADEFRAAQAALAKDEEILRFDCVTLKLSGTWTTSGEASAKVFSVLDITGGAGKEAAQTITVEMEPAPLNDVIMSGLHFLS